MEKVLNITARLEDKKRKEQIEAYRERFDAIQRVLQCSACQFKCAMCNRHIEQESASQFIGRSVKEFTLCNSCQTEFEAYQRICREGRRESDVFWHNREWLHFWSSWLDYQRSVNEFRNSFDFNRISRQAED